VSKAAVAHDQKPSSIVPTWNNFSRKDIFFDAGLEKKIEENIRNVLHSPRPAALLRELMHMGQVVQSHGMHFFELAGPDLLLGFDADPAIRNAGGLLAANPELTIKAINLRKWGQEIIATLGGRRIHPNFAVPGGVNKALSAAEREKILAGYDDAIATIQVGLAIMKDWAEKNAEDINKFAVFPTGYLGLVDENNALELYDGQIRLIDSTGKELEKFDPSLYLDYIAEHVEPWSYLKFPYYKKMGYPHGVYRVGPLGRLNIADKISTPLAEAELKNFKYAGQRQACGEYTLLPLCPPD